MLDGRRREFITLLGGAAAAGSVFRPLAALAEVSPKRRTIAWIAPGTRELGASFIESFLRGMRELGYVEGRSFEMVYRFGDGYQERLPTLIEEVIRLKPTVILATAVASTVPASKRSEAGGQRHRHRALHCGTAGQAD
jgi:putative ABC transport system substrate-binding protein